MPNRKVILSNGEYYHIYNRGNNKQIIFIDNKDKERFIKLLSLLNRVDRLRVDEISLEESFIKQNEQLVAIGAYVLMDNHFHILVKQIADNGVSLFFQKLCTAYVMYFNKKYTRTGGLFEGNFKSKHAGDDVYLQYLYAYIHLNPAKMIDKNWKKSVLLKQKDVVDFIKHYPYSSFHDYCGVTRKEGTILSKKEFPLYFKDGKDFVESILKWLPLEPETDSKTISE